MQDTPLKTCTKCGATHPATAEFFKRQARGKFGVTSRCKKCEKEYHAHLYRTDPRIRERNLAWHQARATPRVKLTDEEKRERQRQRNLKRRQADPAKHAELHRAWRNRPGVAEHLRAYRQSRPEATRAYTRKWASKNPEAVRVQARNRRARKRAAPGSHTVEDVQRKFQQQDGKCYWCRQPLTEYHVDHIVALVQGGSNGPENLCCACPTCNLRKNKKMPWDFAGRLL